MLTPHMRPLLVFLSLLVLSCASTKSAQPAAAPTEAAPAAAAPKPPGEAALGDRTTCPVSGEVFTVKADSPKVVHDGKTYFLCCDDCVADFQKDPAKYLAKSPAP
ncbi:MAG: hypothetical protein AMXMBFR34_37530 [Myxococcaceae bacterium]